MSDGLVWLSQLGGALRSWLPPIVGWTGVVFVSAFVADRLLASRVRAGWRILFYAAVAVRLVLPVQLTTPLGALGAPDAAATAVGVPAGSFAALLHSAIARVEPWDLVVPLGWALGTILLGGAWWAERRRMRLLLVDARPARDGVMALGAGPVVLEHDGVGPLVVGVWRNRIVLPTAIVEALQPDELRAVLGHEAAHIERRDPLLLVILQCLCISLWPVVPLWLAAAQVRRLAELASDERALRGADADARRSYGRTLLALAEWRPVLRPRIDAGVHFGSALESRVAALRSMRRWPAVVQVGLSLVIAASLVACAGRRPSAATPAPRASGQLIDLDFKNADANNVLRLLSDVGHVDIWIDDELAQNPPRLSIHARQIPWDEALNRIFRENRLYAVRQANTVFVSRRARNEGPQRAYTGKRISLDFKNADLRNVMSLLAEVGQVQIEVPDDVNVKVTVAMSEIPWDEAFDVLLWRQGLRAERQGDTIKIARSG